MGVVMRFTLMAFVVLLLLLPWTPIRAGQDADDCIDVRGTIKARIVNRCSYAVNVAVCCEGQGRLPNCQSNDFDTIYLEGNSSKFIASCDGWTIYGACRAPYQLQEFYWDPNVRNMRGGACVLDSGSSDRQDDMRNSDLAGAQMQEMNLFATDLSGSNLSGANLKSAHLNSADLSNANLSNADLEGAKLFRANFSDADLTGASLVGANLDFAQLRGANLTDADLTDARLGTAHTRGAIFCNTQMPDGTVNNDGCP